MIDKTILKILDRAREGIAPTRAECVAMLDCPPASPEASLIRGTADGISRRRFGNQAFIFGQIGIEINACPGRCKFCSFGEGHTTFEAGAMSLDDILASVDSFTTSGDLYALFLMTMHLFDFDRLINIVHAIRERMPSKPDLVVNIGDFDRAQADALKAAGVNGAYHVCRLREGTDTSLDPMRRKETVRIIKDAGLDWYYCCEPIGPEHTSEELVEQMFFGFEHGCTQHAAMRRVYLPNAPLAQYGQITELRLGQATAVVALASLACPDTRIIGVHEPNLIGLTSGANSVFAETGANPRDTEENTAGHRGLDIRACKAMLCEAGFDYLLTPSGERRLIGEVYKI